MNPPRRRLAVRATLTLCLLVAVGLGFQALHDTGELRAFLAASAATEGEVIGHRTHTSLGRQRSTTRMSRDLPVFRYRDADGTVHEAASANPFPRNDYPVGYNLPIRYDTVAHARAEPDEIWGLWGAIIVLWAMPSGSRSPGWRCCGACCVKAERRKVEEEHWRGIRLAGI